MLEAEKVLLRGDGLAERLARVADDAAHGITWLSALGDPVLSARKIEVGVVALLLRIVVPDDLDELPVAGATCVCYDDLVVRTLAGAFAAEADGNCHSLY